MSGMYTFQIVPSGEDIRHYGIKGQQWGVRRYQNEDGSLTPAGKERYNDSNGGGRSGGLKGVKATQAGGLDNYIKSGTKNVPFSVAATYGLPKENKTASPEANHVNMAGWKFEKTNSKEKTDYSSFKPKSYKLDGILETGDAIREQQREEHRDDPSWDPESDPEYGIVTCDITSSNFKTSDLYWGVVEAVEDHGVNLGRLKEGITNVRVQTSDDHNVEPWVVVDFMDGKKSRQISVPFYSIMEYREKTKRRR